MRRLIGFAMLVLLSAEALAATVIVDWELPTLYEDGSAIVPGDLTATRLQFGTCTSTTPAVFGVPSRPDKVVLTPAVTNTFASVPNGTFCIQGFIQAGTQESAASNVLVIQVANKPRAPLMYSVKFQ